MKSSQTRPLVYSTLSRSDSRNHESAGLSQCSNVPRSPLHPVNAPLTSMSIFTSPPAGKSTGRNKIASFGPGRLAFHHAAVIERQSELDRRVASQLLVGMGMAAVDRPDRSVAVVPAKPDVADAAVDFGMHVNGEDGPARRQSPSFLIENRLMYWPGEVSRPALVGRQSPITAMSVIITLIGPRRQESLVVSRFVTPRYC